MANCRRCGTFILYGAECSRCREAGDSGPHQPVGPALADPTFMRLCAAGLMVLLALAGLNFFLRPAPRAGRYYKDGVRYKEMGWPEKSRQSLALAIQLDPDGIGADAARYMRTKLPAVPVPDEAVAENIKGYNLMAACRLDEASAVFEDCIRRWPGFEWPYGNLAMVSLARKDLPKAKALVEKALALNPCYVNGWLHLAEVRALAGDSAGRDEAIASALACDPEDKAALWLRDAPEGRTRMFSDVAHCRQD